MRCRKRAESVSWRLAREEESMKKRTGSFLESPRNNLRQSAKSADKEGFRNYGIEGLRNWLNDCPFV